MQCYQLDPCMSFDQLRKEFENDNMAKVGAILPELLPQPASPHYQPVLEIAALYSAHQRDGMAFERYFDQLSALHYFSLKTESEESSTKWKIIGLQLMNLLVTGRLPDFHVLLERIPEQHLASNPFIAFPLQMEQSLIEGMFHRVLASRSMVPAPEYTWFIDGLMETIRNELASCVEASFDVLPLQQVGTFLLVRPGEESMILAFAQLRDWNVENGLVHLKQSSTPIHFNPHQYICRSLNYANFIEQII